MDRFGASRATLYNYGLRKHRLPATKPTPKRWQKSVAGCVSRASPVHTVVRNYTRDEGRPFGFGRQGSIPSHRRLLS